MSRWIAPEIWKGGRCWIIGGGHSLPFQFGIPGEVIKNVCDRKGTPAHYASYIQPVIGGEHVIGVNNAYQLGDWLDFLFFGDGSWHLVHQYKLMSWSGIRVTCAPKFAGISNLSQFGLRYMPKNKSHSQGISDVPGTVAWNGNSGAAAISLARWLGVRQILLLGFDMSSNGKYSHWHGSHGNKPNRKAPPYARHLRGFGPIAADAKKLGIEILNVNKLSKIEAFPKVSLKEALSA